MIAIYFAVLLLIIYLCSKSLFFGIPILLVFFSVYGPFVFQQKDTPKEEEKPHKEEESEEINDIREEEPEEPEEEPEILIHF